MLFADVTDSTGLYGRHGDARARSIIAQCVALMSAIGRRHRGVLVKTIGDEIMCRFDLADQAARAACGIHEALENRERFGGAAVSAHVGLHFGPAYVDEADVHGEAVNIAASMTTIAKPRQIITTRDTIDHLSPEVAVLTRLYDIVTLKGTRREMPIYEVLWERENVTTILTRLDLAALTPVSRVQLRYREGEVSVTPEAPVALIGRSSECHLVVNANLVSRIHARVEHRRDKFILMDQSTNGTFVKPDDGQEIYLRREEMPLSGRGVIGLGKAARAGDADAILYCAQ